MSLERDSSQKLSKRSLVQEEFASKRQALMSDQDDTQVVDEYKTADPKKWTLKTEIFAGGFADRIKNETVKGKLISDGILHFEENPSKYIAMFFHKDGPSVPEEDQEFTYVQRSDTGNFFPLNIGQGDFKLLIHKFHRLPPLENDVLPENHRDKYTDDMVYDKLKIHTEDNKPILPGRGMGVLDVPGLKIIGQVDPSDVRQGLVGDCWLLSSISTLAEYDGAVRRLFRKTKDLDLMPFDDKPNLYTITLWDLKTWKEVDIVVDERLCARPDAKNHLGAKKLLGAKPSANDNELWVPYLEKAIVAHCGGWDAISYGANCNHAWSVLTGIKEQYAILRKSDNGEEGNNNWECLSKYNPSTEVWAEQDSNPWKGSQDFWSVPWPASEEEDDWEEQTDEELFKRMCVWNDKNFLMACSSKGDSDANLTDGIVDAHAYGVMDCRENVAGSGLDMIQLRNPWGYGECEKCQFVRDGGSGWKEYPKVKEVLKPVDDDPGVFWLTREEFFKYYIRVNVSGKSMAEFLGVEQMMPFAPALVETSGSESSMSEQQDSYDPARMHAYGDDGDVENNKKIQSSLVTPTASNPPNKKIFLFCALLFLALVGVSAWQLYPYLFEDDLPIIASNESDAPLSLAPTSGPATAIPTTAIPTTLSPTAAPTITPVPTMTPTTSPPTVTPVPTAVPTTSFPTIEPTDFPSAAPTEPVITDTPTSVPSAENPTKAPVDPTPSITPPPVPNTTSDPTASPVTPAPSKAPVTRAPTSFPTSAPTPVPVTSSPTKSPSASPNTPAPSSGVKGRLQQIFSDISGTAVYDDPNSPQSLAIDYIVDGGYALETFEALTDLYAFVTFYFSTGGDSWFSGNWLEGDICDWKYIKCNRGGFVTSLIIERENGLTGVIPVEITAPGYLEELVVVNQEGLLTSTSSN